MAEAKLRTERGEGKAQAPAASGSRGFTNGSQVTPSGDRVGRTNGLARGRVNGLTNGLTNGVTNGLTNGLTNGRRSRNPGLTNGLTNGVTNGLADGFTNGSGAVNGFRISSGSRRMSRQPADVRRKMFMVAALVLIIMVIPYALVYAFPPAEVEVDGYFMDWLKATVYEDTPDSEVPDVSISAYATKYDARGSYFYVATDGTVMNGAEGGADGFYIFIDRDGDAGTGYLVRGLGADHMVAVIGWNGTVALQATYVFSASASQDDYAGFQRSSDPLVAFRGGEVEVGTSLVTGPSSRFSVCARHTNTTDDWSEVNFARSGPAVAVLQEFVAPEVTEGYTDERMFNLVITVKDASVDLEGLVLETSGTVVPVEVKVTRGSELLGSGAGDEIMFQEPVRLREGEPVTLSVAASFPAGSDTGSFGLSIDGAEGLVLGSNATVTVTSVQTGSRMTYVGSAPTSITVDGAFADWGTVPTSEDPLGDVVLEGVGLFANADVDISSVVAWSAGPNAYFYMSVDGRMMGGSSLPGALVRWAEPPEPAGSMPNITGEEHLFGADFAYAFIDLDGNASTGFAVGGAESAVAVSGKDGVVMSAEAFAFVDGAWVPTREVQAAADGYRLEVGAAIEALGMSVEEDYHITFMAQDWRGSEDYAAAPLPVGILAGIRSIGGVVINEVYSSVPGASNDWLELYNTASYAIDITGWTLYVNGVLTYTFPSYVLPSGGFFVTPDLNFWKGTTYVLYDSTGTLVDSITVPTWNVRSYGRTGTPDTGYDTWAWMVPTPGEINQGQIPIPEFGDLVAPLAIVPIILIVIRRARRTRGSARWDSEGNTDGST